MIPNPVSLSPALKAILAKSKQVMNKTDINKPIVSKHTSNINEGYSSENYNEADEREPNYPTSENNTTIAPLQNFSREHIMASNLPANVKEAMINKPIPKISLASGFSKEDIDFINPKNKQQQTKTVINESITNNSVNTNSDLITISRSELKEIMNETLVNFLKTNYEKTLTESAITKTINLLIKEGKITVKKKVI